MVSGGLGGSAPANEGGGPGSTAGAEYMVVVVVVGLVELRWRRSSSSGEGADVQSELLSHSGTRFFTISENLVADSRACQRAWLLISSLICEGPTRLCGWTHPFSGHLLNRFNGVNKNIELEKIIFNLMY